MVLARVPPPLPAMSSMVFIMVFFVLLANELQAQSIFDCILSESFCFSSVKDVRVGQARCACPSLMYPLESPTKINGSWRLVCRTRQSLSFARDLSLSSDGAWSMVYYQEEGSELQPLALLNQTRLTVNGLHPGTSYRFRFAPLLDDGSCEGVEDVNNGVITTFSEDMVPDPVRIVLIQGWIPGNDSVQAIVKWSPGASSSCYFHFMWQSEMEIYKKEVKVEDAYEVVLSPMLYSRNYTLFVTSVLLNNDGEFDGESKSVSVALPTPRCLALNNNSLDICPPEPLEGLLVEEVLVMEGRNNDSARYNVTVYWNTPEVRPDQVLVNLKPLFIGNHSLQQTVTGNETSITFAYVELGYSFKLRAWATSAAGPGRPVQLVREIPETAPNNDASMGLVDKMILSVAVLCCLMAATALFFYIRTSRARHTMNHQANKEMAIFRKNSQLSTESMKIYADPAIALLDDRYEVPRDAVTLYGVLGEGAFGVVRKGVLTRNSQEELVAVKTLKGKPSEEEKEQLVQEMSLLHAMARHNHVLGMVACVTACRVQDMLLVVEYCAHGDLQRYLQNIRLRHLASSEKLHPFFNHGKCVEAQNGDAVVNQLYDALSTGASAPGDVPVSAEDLISFAWQVADGMEFLAGNRIIHRDLAARNVLVTADKTLKISDFGLSRDVYERNCYVKTGDGKVPLKWMAIESLLYHKYTTQSDVWSFGVLMWEIMTFGSMPYSQATPLNLVDFLSSGQRLPCPDNTSADLYTVMMACWSLKPCDRPRFSDLKTTLDGMLEPETMLTTLVY